METAKTISLPEKNRDKKRLFYDCVFIAGFLFSLIPGPIPSLSSLASILLLGCIAVSFMDENFYLYMAIFVYLRYIDAESGFAETEAAEMTGVPVTDAAASAKAYSMLCFVCKDGEAVVDEVLARAFAK